MNTRTNFASRVVIAASLGYLVDLFDTFLLPALRIPTMKDFGVAAASSYRVGTNLFTLQLVGQAIGALLVWGPLSDRYGRKKVLFASISIYGVANIATAFAHGLTDFAVIRFIAGIGLGGELGAGIALISESMAPENRSKGTMFVGFFGMLGVVLAGLLAKSSLSWRTDYLLGGVLAFVILAFRFGAHESHLFKRSVAAEKPSYWRILLYLARPTNFFKLAACVLVGAPTFFVVGILVTGAPETGTALGMRLKPTGADALVWTYSSIAIGCILCGWLAQYFKSQRIALLVFHAVTLVGFSMILFVPATQPSGYYWRCSLTGLGIGYWANMVSNASEQWGTNVRGTVTIAVPNFVRVLLILINPLFLMLRPYFGYIPAAAIIGFVCSGLAIISILVLQDGFRRDLNFVEDIGPKPNQLQAVQTNI
jgi:MFS transporter, putative metabolite:H+ symporter